MAVRLGELLVARGLINDGQLAVALAEQRETRERLGAILVRRRVVDQRAMLDVLAESLQVPHVDLTKAVVVPDAARLIPADDARRMLAIPFGYEGNRLKVAMADPSDLFTVDDIGHRTGWRVERMLADASQILATIDRVWRPAELPPTTPDGDVLFPDLRELSQIVDSVNAPQVVDVVDELLMAAVQQGASEVHLEPLPDELRVRFRVDGVLHDAGRIAPSLREACIRRLKVLASLDLSERRAPQDGWIAFEANGRRVDVGMITLPTAEGEAVSLRVRDTDGAEMKVGDLGLLDAQHAAFLLAVERPAGVILVAGPAGSGRSTTLYAALAHLNDEGRNIVTIEELLERRVTGVKQMQVRPDEGLTAVGAMRAALRTNADVVLIGEIRDAETARLACEASLMGHLVLAGIHATDAPSALLRFGEMGVEGFLVTSAVSCVVAQRLVRRSCSTCLAAVDAPALDGGGPSSGCEECRSTGYRGRVALFEVLSMSEEIARQVAAGSGATAIRGTAVEQGMTTLYEDGAAKAALGRTTLAELTRI